MFIDQSKVKTPEPGIDWRKLNAKERISIVNEIKLMHEAFDSIEIVGAEDNGYVYVRLQGLLSAGMRGQILLDLEEIIKRDIDAGLTIWCEPLGDKSSLRRLRGIEIKS